MVREANGFGRRLTVVIFWLLLSQNFNAGVSADGSCIVQCATENIGESETNGPNRSPFIDAINKLVKAPVGSPWCASATSYWHYMCGVDNPMSAYSPNWFKDKDCYFIRGKKDEDRIRPGDTGGIYFPSKKRIAHIFLTERTEDKWVCTIEGNTNDDGSREGTKCMRRKRLKSGIERMSRHWD